jgi:Ca-activated chloride channel family protein
VCALACALPLHGSHAQDLPTFRSAVTLVPISAVVRDHRGRLVTNLTASDFEVIDAGEPRPILDFQQDRSGPVALALLMDASGSMKMPAKMRFAQQVLDGLVGELADGRDEAALFTFDSSLQERQPFTSDAAQVGRHLEDIDPFGLTSLHDAIADAARRLAERPHRHRALIVVTDGLDTSSALAPEQVSAIASSIDVPVYVVLAVPPIDRSRFTRRLADGASNGESELLNLAQWTGGDLLFASAPDHGPSVARQIISELRHQYVIAIESSDRSEWRRLDVRVRRERMKVAARGGYFGR